MTTERQNELLEGVLLGPVPRESRATCSQCAMCHQPALGFATAFEPSAKCCTYLPTLPNYLVGSILADRTQEQAEGRRRVLERVQSQLAVTPLRLGMSPSYAERYRSISGPQGPGFGRDVSMLCPYNADDGRCTIWRHRNGVCATWFCKHERGVFGQRFWRAVHELLKQVETTLALHCAIELDVGAEALATLVDEAGEPRDLGRGELHGFVDPDGRCEPELRRRIWGPWIDREVEFFVACHEIGARLDARHVLDLGGPRVAVLARRVVEAYRRLGRTALPDRVVLARSDEVPNDELAAVVMRVPQAFYDPVRLSLEVRDALAEFDGRDLGDALAAAHGRSSEVDSTLVAALIDKGILVEPSADVTPHDASRAPLEPDDELRFFRGYLDEAVLHDVRLGEFEIHCGSKNVLFDEPHLLEFGRQLAKHQNGFVAGDCVRWTSAAHSLAWSDVRPLLETLLAENVLQRRTSARTS